MDFNDLNRNYVHILISNPKYPKLHIKLDRQKEKEDWQTYGTTQQNGTFLKPTNTLSAASVANLSSWIEGAIVEWMSPHFHKM